MYSRSIPAFIRVCRLAIYRNFSYKIVEKLENGTIDVGIVTLPVKSSSLKTHAIFRDQLMLMVNPQNPLAKHDVVPVSEIAKQPLLLPKTGYSRRVDGQVIPSLCCAIADQDGITKRGND